MSKIDVLDHGFIQLVDHMGDDSAIVQAARVSYGNDGKEHNSSSDRNLIRYLLNHDHGTPFEMVEFKFCVQAPMDVMRQWIRHRMANTNEYSTRYMEAIDLCYSTHPREWRLQSKDNKQGSSGFAPPDHGHTLSATEFEFHRLAKEVYQARLAGGIAKEQARKDLPLSTYTRLYWKCDLRNIFNFLRLRMDSHAQWEIRQYANAMYDLIKPIVPVACEAFEDYVLHAKKFSRMEMELIRELFHCVLVDSDGSVLTDKPSSMTDREWKEFLGKLQ
jgi:thymidylate synthase (FAD)